MNDNKPKRKHPRLKNFDYSSPGAYFITICTKQRRRVFSDIINTVESKSESDLVKYTEYGKIAEVNLLTLQERYSHLSVDKYVIMPNHIHVILILANDTAGASPRPTVMDIISAYKSITTRECRKLGYCEKLFQDSFYEHVIRNKEDYENTVKYICDNPINWYYDELYTV